MHKFEACLRLISATDTGANISVALLFDSETHEPAGVELAALDVNDGEILRVAADTFEEAVEELCNSLKAVADRVREAAAVLYEEDTE